MKQSEEVFCGTSNFEHLRPACIGKAAMLPWQAIYFRSHPVVSINRYPFFLFLSFIALPSIVLPQYEKCVKKIAASN